VSRRATWRWVSREWVRRAGTARFLLGTFLDRQEARLRTHPYRRALGVGYVAPMDHSALRTRAADSPLCQHD